MTRHPPTGQVACSATPLRDGAVPLWSCAQHAWCSVDHWLHRYDHASGTLRPVFRVPRPSDKPLARLKDALARSAVRQWLRPGASVQHLVELPGGDLVVVFDRVYWYSPPVHGRSAEPLRCDIQPAMATPLRGGMAVHPVSRCVYYGEYNDDPQGARVARVDVANRRVAVCWHFPRSEIRHIHAIHHDRFRNRLWICTGDRDHESSFYYTDDEFATVHRFAGGDQSWRAVAMLFDATGMEWGMDAGKDAPADAVNRIYRYEFATGERTERAVIGNPAYAACEFTDGTAMMQTTFEPGRLQDTPEAAALWFRGADRQWRPCHSLPYAPKPRPGSSRYGAILLPQGISPAGQVLATPVNCQPGHYHMAQLRWAGA